MNNINNSKALVSPFVIYKYLMLVVNLSILFQRTYNGDVRV